ncbi:glucosyltransferase domain-containing protein [uncultured Treponema sp.]|uniref:glucosyltransferase domain-containing protein n=1 Tax=uncultured Treponema sp. TaxID=162155 RepID=UPI0025E10C65|nr:glucosyltransferase domain-containing protein [uncultured Treponema sp.]
MINTANNTKKTIFSVLYSITVLFCIGLKLNFIDKQILVIAEKIFSKTLRKPEKWIEIVHHTSSLVIFITSIVYFLIFTKSGAQLYSKIKESLYAFYNKLSSEKLYQHFAFILVFLFLVFFKVIAANYFYADDVFRNYTGNRSWIGFSRYISEFFSIFLHTNINLNDIAPLSQIITIFIMAATLIMARGIFESEKNSILKLLSLSFIFISPYFVENFSYRFDCPYMALSVFFSIFPFIFKDNLFLFSFVSTVSLIFTSISYQAALGIFIIFSIFIFFENFIQNKSIKSCIKFLSACCFSFILAMLIFKLFFMNTISNNSDDYFSSKTGFFYIFTNSFTYLKTTFSLFGNKLMKVLWISSIICFLFVSVKQSKRNKFITIFISIITILVSYILSYGPYLIFERPVMLARAFMGFNAFIALVLMSIANYIEIKKSYCMQTILIFLIYSAIVFQYTYGNCIINQKEYENYRIQMILNDLSSITNKENDYKIDIKGNIDFSKKNRIALKNYPLLKSMIPQTLRETSSWNDEIFNGYNFKCKQESLSLTEQFNCVIKNYYYVIYKCDNKIIIFLS